MFELQGPKHLCNIVIGDGTKLYLCGIPHKPSNQMWEADDGKRPAVLWPGF